MVKLFFPRRGFRRRKKEKMRNKLLVVVEIAIVVCSLFLVAPVIAADQTMQKTITTASEDDFTLGIYGNANEDDTIDMRDTTYIKLAIFKKKPETKLADANYDGKVSMLDVGQTKLIILGKEKKLTVIDSADRTVTIKKPIDRVVLTSRFEEFIMLEGEDAFGKIVGWNRGYWEGRRQWFWEKYTDAFPEIEEIPDLGYPYKGTFSVEEAVVLKPDVVLMSMWEHHCEEVWKRLEQAGVPVVFTDYLAMSLETYTKSTLLLGYVLDKEERAQEAMEFYKEHTNIVYSRLDEIEGRPKPKVYMESGGRKWNAYGPEKLQGAMVVSAGGENIAKITGEISPEYVLDANPDVIVMTGSNWPGNPGTVKLGYYADPEESRELLKARVDRPGWNLLNAVINQRIYSVHHSHAHIYDCITLQRFAKWFYPDVFEDIDPEKNWEEFHEKFFPVDYSGVWAISIKDE